MNLMEELARQELARRKAEQDAVKSERERSQLWVQKTGELWGRVKAGIETRLTNYNALLPEPVAFLRENGPCILEIIKESRRRTVGEVHLSTQTECIEFTLTLKIGPDSSQLGEQLNYPLDLGSTSGNLNVVDAATGKPIHEENLLDILVRMALTAR
jgi:hypothetical protein